MNTWPRFVPLAFLSVLSAVAGCGPDDGQPSQCPHGAICDSSTLVGTPRGLRDDGTVDITVAEVWPNRRAEPVPLSATQLGQACSLMAACANVDDCGADTGCIGLARQQFLAACVIPELTLIWEERAVPDPSSNERWSYVLREVLKSGGDCAAVNGNTTERAPQIVCEEAGCWWYSFDRPVPEVTCQGDVATLHSNAATYVRDCSRAWQKCDPSSPTGCTDRAPTACEHPAKDRCDGTVRLGCDGNGRVSFHDCSRVPGGTCGELGDGRLGCVYPRAGECAEAAPTCEGDAVKVCVLGESVSVDCKGLGLSGCQSGACIPE